jgi:hypothetical protein
MKRVSIYLYNDRLPYLKNVIEQLSCDDIFKIVSVEEHSKDMSLVTFEYSHDKESSICLLFFAAGFNMGLDKGFDICVPKQKAIDNI